MNAIWQDRLAYFSWHFLGEFFLHSYIFLGEKSVCDIIIYFLHNWRRYVYKNISHIKKTKAQFSAGKEIEFLYLQLTLFYSAERIQRILNPYSKLHTYRKLAREMETNYLWTTYPWSFWAYWVRSCGPKIQYKKLAKSQTIFSKSFSLHGSERNYCSPTLVMN